VRLNADATSGGFADVRLKPPATSGPAGITPSANAPMLQYATIALTIHHG
jgi:hypothetical protein